MPKPKKFLSQAKPPSKKSQNRAPDSADEFLAAGVELEEAGGKWRAGDAAKSFRFFTKAIDMYTQGLARFPKSLDLAYNKAHVELEMATHPVLVAQLDRPLMEVLRDALASHQYALELDTTNADSLFNTAQVWTCIGEELANDGEAAEAVEALEQALTFQSQCLAIQEKQYEQSLALRKQHEYDDNTSGDVDAAANEQSPGESEASGQEEMQWVSVVEPVTLGTLLDALSAQMATLTTLQDICLDYPHILRDVSSRHATASADLMTNLREKLNSYLNLTQSDQDDSVGDSIPEALLAEAKLVSSVLQVVYKIGQVDAAAFKTERDAVFQRPLTHPHSDIVEARIANARSLIGFSSALGRVEQFSHSGDIRDGGLDMTQARREALTASIAELKTAAEASGIDKDTKATTHLLRGDASLCLAAVNGTSPSGYAQLLRNADVYYRNAAKLSPSEGDVAQLRAAVARGLLQYLEAGGHPGGASGNIQAAAVIAAKDLGQLEQWAAEQLEDMLAEGILMEGIL